MDQLTEQDRKDIMAALEFTCRFYVHIEGDAPTETRFVERISKIKEKLND